MRKKMNSPERQNYQTFITLIIGAGMRKNVSQLLGLHHRLITPVQFMDEMNQDSVSQGLYIFVMDNFKAVNRLVQSTSLTIRIPLSALWWPQKNEVKQEDLMICAQNAIAFVPSISQNQPMAIKMIHGRLQLLKEIAERFEVKSIPVDNPQNRMTSAKNLKMAKKISAYLEENFSNEYLCIDKMGQDLGMSRTSFYNKVKSIAGCSPSKFVTSFRLNKAKELLSAGEGISEVAFLVGFSSTSYFTKCFKEFFKCTPSYFLKQNNNRSTHQQNRLAVQNGTLNPLRNQTGLSLKSTNQL